MDSDLLESLEIFSHLQKEKVNIGIESTRRGNTNLGVKLIGQELSVLSVDNILLSVHEPVGDLELGRVLDDGDDSLELIGVELSSSANRDK